MSKYLLLGALVESRVVRWHKRGARIIDGVPVCIAANARGQTSFLESLTGDAAVTSSCR